MSEVFVPDNLVAGHFPMAVTMETVKAGEGVLKRGTVLGRVTADGKLRKVNSANTDGSQSPVAVLSCDTDATSDAAAAVYQTGEFNERALVFGGADTAATHRRAAEARNLYFRATQQ
jgi:hypothetical protein